MENQSQRKTEISDFFESYTSTVQELTSQVKSLQNVTNNLSIGLENEKQRIDQLSEEKDALVLPEIEERTIDLVNQTAMLMLDVSILQLASCRMYVECSMYVVLRWRLSILAYFYPSIFRVELTNWRLELMLLMRIIRSLLRKATTYVDILAISPQKVWKHCSMVLMMLL